MPSIVETSHSQILIGSLQANSQDQVVDRRRHVIGSSMLRGPEGDIVGQAGVRKEVDKAASDRGVGGDSGDDVDAVQIWRMAGHRDGRFCVSSVDAGEATGLLGEGIGVDAGGDELADGLEEGEGGGVADEDWRGSIR